MTATLRLRSTRTRSALRASRRRSTQMLDGSLNMANGKLGDNPLSDMFIHGKHPFPADIEQMIRKLDSLGHIPLDALQWAPFDWNQGRFHAEARKLLKGLIESYGNRGATQKLIAEYRDATHPKDE